MPTFDLTAPTPELAQELGTTLGTIRLDFVPGHGGLASATGTLLGGMYTVRVPWSGTSTGTGNPNWINPESGTVIAKAYIVITTAGTGTYNLGRGSDGTGTSAVMVSVGTLIVGVSHQINTGSAAMTSGTSGQTNQGWWLIGPGGTGTNNSIVARVVDTPTSTMAMYMVVQYFKVE